jgi:hypothetical protein
MAFRRHSGVLGLPHALQFLDSHLPPDSIHFGRGGLGVFGYLYWDTVMGIEPSLRVDESTHCAVSLPEENDAPSLWGDEHSDDMHSLLEENG